MGNLGPLEILGILAVVILLFGAKRLPDVARGAGQSLRIFKSEVKGDGADDEAKPEALEADVSVEKKPEQQG